MKKALLIAAIAAWSIIPTLAETPAFANETIAQSTTQAAPAMKAAMDTLRDQISTMVPSGNVDTDYKTSMKMLGTAMKAVVEAEMRNGNNPAMVETAKQVYERVFESNMNPFFVGG